MGAVQQPTQDMGPYKVEARSESFVLRRAGFVGDAVGREGSADTARPFVPAAEVPQILAALDQARPFAAKAEGAVQGPEAQAIINRPWQVKVDGVVLWISGPCWTSLDEYQELRLAFVEIPYGRLAELRGLLEALQVSA